MQPPTPVREKTPSPVSVEEERPVSSEISFDFVKERSPPELPAIEVPDLPDIQERKVSTRKTCINQKDKFVARATHMIQKNRNCCQKDGCEPDKCDSRAEFSHFLLIDNYGSNGSPEKAADALNRHCRLRSRRLMVRNMFILIWPLGEPRSCYINSC